MNWLKRICSIVGVVVMAVTISACGSFEPCESCGKSPTKVYMNNYSNEKEYYCTECASDCEFCSDKATEHYTSGLGVILFVCKDCYEEIQSYN